MDDNRWISARNQVSLPVARGMWSSGLDAVIAALRGALHAYDRCTGEHSDETEALAARVADQLGIDDEEAALVVQVAALHDVGKIGIPSHILHKPGPLDEAEFALMREHPVIGERILTGIAGLGRVARGVRHEHERWDGGGYPDGLARDEIPLASRIVLACDAWHAMTSDRPYRPAMARDDAILELRRCSGSQFDPTVTTALLDVLGVLEGEAALAA